MNLADRLKVAAKRLKRDVVALWLAARDPDTPLAARLVAFLTAAYALSPIDLIPDVIPVLGLLDDLVLVPAGIWLALRLIPKTQISRLRRQAEAIGRRPKSRLGLVLVVAIWMSGLALVLHVTWSRLFTAG
ncbi:YkvA family protein [Fulvimarina endophytica]|uniref:YkvA family protein n=1 Tax=Fulvimarina endophytica TaxID=2293836 RepID=UPI001FDF2DB0|nr:DUF1232 domain-containing protein [Fulvimarina endophytica]